MKQIEYQHLLAERSQVERMIAETPEEFVLDRESMMHRLDVVQALIDAAVGSVEEVARALDRIRQENIVEDERDLVGAFLGVLPLSRSAEFTVAEPESVIKARIDPEVPDLVALNRRLGERVTIRVRQTTVAKGKPRYVVLRVSPTPEAE
jgi:hypothetical protein